MEYRNDIAQLISLVLKEAGRGEDLSVEEISALLEVPKDSSHGDWALPCFQLAKTLRKAPQQIAAELEPVFQDKIAENEQLQEVSAAGPYLNFTLNKGSVAAQLIPQILDGSFIAPEEQKDEKVMIEYSQPNTHKAFHVGHIRCATLGDCLTRLFEWNGHEVVPVNYIGDEGTHVAKCLWYFEKHFNGEVPEENRGEFLGELYVNATELLDLSLLTEAPFPGVTAAEIISTAPHPEESEWTVVEINTALGKKTVVTAAHTPSESGTSVPWAQPGVRVKGRTVGEIEKKGVLSQGMLCSAEEIGVGEDKDTVLVLPGTPKVGTEVAEIYRKEGALADGVSVLEELRQREGEVGEVLQRIEAGEPETIELWNKTKEWSMEELYEAYEWLRCRFDHYFYESEFGESSKALVKKYQAKGIFKEDDGAVGADLNEWGLGFCLLIKRDGTALYATRDLALAEKKFEEFGIDRSLYIVDAAQTLHFKQVFKCLELMGFSQAEKSFHLPYAQVVRPDGKMSSRKGNVILFSELRSRLVEKIRSEFLEKYVGEWDEAEVHETAYRLALATMRYGMMNQDNNSQIVFDLDEWTARTGNTGPYMMYAYARIQSILREVDVSTEPADTDWALLNTPVEEELLLHLNGYRQCLQRAYDQYAPSQVCAYIYELSKKFNRMYQECSVKNAESEALQRARAALVRSSGIIIQHGLSLLGVETVDRM